MQVIHSAEMGALAAGTDCSLESLAQEQIAAITDHERRVKQATSDAFRPESPRCDGCRSGCVTGDDAGLRTMRRFEVLFDEKTNEINISGATFRPTVFTARRRSVLSNLHGQ
jgi:hypothetical protein